MGSIKWTRQYFAMLATPLGTRDIVLGHQLWMTARVAMTSAVYLAVIAAFGGVDSPLRHPGVARGGAARCCLHDSVRGLRGNA